MAPTPSMARPIPQETKAARRTRFRRGRTRSDKRPPPPPPPGDDRNEDGDDVWLLLDGLWAAIWWQALPSATSLWLLLDTVVRDGDIALKKRGKEVKSP